VTAHVRSGDRQAQGRACEIAERVRRTALRQLPVGKARTRAKRLIERC